MELDTGRVRGRPWVVSDLRVNVRYGWEADIQRPLILRRPVPSKHQVGSLQQWANIRTGLQLPNQRS